MRLRYLVNLEDLERARLLEIIQKGQHASRKVRRAHTLLLAEEGAKDEAIAQAIAQALQTSLFTVERTRKRFVEEGLDAALSDAPRSGRPGKLDGKQEALLVATACSTPPEGRADWTMQLLADQMVESGVVDSISDETIRGMLKKNSSNRGSTSSGASGSGASAG
jgi:transposase